MSMTLGCIFKISIDFRRKQKIKKCLNLFSRDGINWFYFRFYLNSASIFTLQKRLLYFFATFPSETSLTKASDGICAGAQWFESGVTVAGAHGLGSDMNQSYSSDGLFVDEYATIYVVDSRNGRIIKWPSGATSGHLVAGGKGSGNGTDQLYYPIDVVGSKNGTIYVTDYEKSRVQQWSQGASSGQTIMKNHHFTGIGQDDEGSLYTSEWTPNLIIKWGKGDTDGKVLENKLDSPDRLFVDRNHSVYVADRFSHRVMKIVEGKESMIIGGSKGANASQLDSPRSVTVDRSGNIYVADTNNHRIMRWLPGAKSGTLVVGGRNQGSMPNQLNAPTDLQFDRCGNLYVADSGNARVQKFLLNMSSC
jgi:sugar lactone lactonase YvrE